MELSDAPEKIPINAKQNTKYIPQIITVTTGGLFSIDMLQHKIPVHYIKWEKCS